MSQLLELQHLLLYYMMMIDWIKSEEGGFYPPTPSHLLKIIVYPTHKMVSMLFQKWGLLWTATSQQTCVSNEERAVILNICCQTLAPNLFTKIYCTELLCEQLNQLFCIAVNEVRPQWEHMSVQAVLSKEKVNYSYKYKDTLSYRDL